MMDFISLVVLATGVFFAGYWHGKRVEAGLYLDQFYELTERIMELESQIDLQRLPKRKNAR